MDVCFQRLRPLHYPRVLYHLARGRRVRAFDFDCDIRSIGWARRLIDAGRLEWLYIRPYCAEHGDAIDAVESEAVRWAPAEILLGGEARLVLKKCRLEKAFERVYLSRNAPPGVLIKESGL